MSNRRGWIGSLVLGGVAVTAALVVGGSAWAQDAVVESRPGLSELSKQKRAAYRVPEEEREDALREVAAAYGRLAKDETRSLAVRCEAAFRAGEILRARKDVEAARAWFTSAFTWGEGGQGAEGEREFAARAWLELAHIHRREGEVEEALAIYEELPRRFDDQRRTAAHATTWRGKLMLDAEELEAAGDVLLGFADAFPEYPEEAVRNADRLAMAYLEGEDEARAREVLARVEAAMQRHVEGDGRVAESVRAALEKMRVRDHLRSDAG